MQKITTFLWFTAEAEEAAKFYTSIFPNSKIGKIVRNNEASMGPNGAVMTVEFTLDGQEFTALNGGPIFTFSEAISFCVECASQDEVDYYWNTLIDDGGEPSQCGWLKDRYGVSWQIVPTVLDEMMKDPDENRARRTTEAMLEMKKLDVAELKRAYAG